MLRTLYTVTYNSARLLLVLFVAVIICQACSNTRHLPAGSSLYVGNHIKIADNIASKKERKLLVKDIDGIIHPKPNSTFLGVRLKLALYNLPGKKTDRKGLAAKFRKKLGEAPVLAKTVSIDANKDLITNYLHNRGFFKAHTTGEMKTNAKRKTVAHFDVITGVQYKLDKVVFVDDSTRVAKAIMADFSHTLLTQNAPYNLNLIKAERTRIDRLLKEKGFYFFKPDYIFTIADSSVGGNMVNLYVRLKHRDIPDEAYAVYKIGDIFIYANYRLRGDGRDTSNADSVKIANYYVIDKQKKFNPAIFEQAMIFEKGDIYSLNDQNASLSRLINMGTFKFVKNRFEVRGDSLLDVFYYLTPFPKKSVRFEVGGLTQNDNRIGTQASISWRNRNTFKGAEMLMFKINGGIEKQYGGSAQQPNIYNFGLESNLSAPKFVIPFADVYNTSRFVPHSIVKLRYNYESQSNLLRISSYSASAGYEWKEGPRKEHQLYPINFTLVKTDTLGNSEKLNLLFSNLVFNGIIIGPTYHFSYNSQNTQSQKLSVFFDGLADLSGNILGVLQNADNRTRPRYLFGSPFAQYIKLQPDFRVYYRPGGATTLVARAMAGIGVPWGNSWQLPNVKQFWAGGNSSLRGFPSRLVGPGTFYASRSGGYIGTLGDLKLEFNAEARQKIYRFINGAIFVDAGNIWLYRQNPDFEGGEFSSNFFRELAANTGFGLRFDFQILILRLDLGIPIRKPWLDEGERWVMNKFDFSDRTWRRENLIFNIAIGYPF